MSTDDLYGLNGTNLEIARNAVETALGIELVAHESSLRAGDYYRSGRSRHEHFILQRNYDRFEDEWFEPASKDYAFLLYVSASSRSKEIETRLAKLGCLLKRNALAR